MRRLQIRLLTVIGTLLLIIMSGRPVQAKKVPSSTQALHEVTFMIQPEMPADNIGGQKLGYFNLKMTWQQTRRLNITVYNPTNHPITIQAKVVNANTLDDGVINYTGAKKNDPRLLPQPAKYFVQVPAKVRLGPGATQKVPLIIKAINKPFKGEKVMAVNLYDAATRHNTAIKNHYTYAVGLVLQGKSLATKPTLQANRIVARMTEGKPALSILFTNKQPWLWQNTQIKMTLKNTKWPIFQYHDRKVALKIAPQSRFYNNLDLTGYRLVPGLYRLKTEIKDQTHRQTLSKYVRITRDQAEFINRQNYVYLQNRTRILISIAVIIGLIALIIGGLSRRKKHAKTH